MKTTRTNTPHSDEILANIIRNDTQEMLRNDMTRRWHRVSTTHSISYIILTCILIASSAAITTSLASTQPCKGYRVTTMTYSELINHTQKKLCIS